MKEMYVTLGLNLSRPCLNSVLAGTILLAKASPTFCHQPGQNLKASQIFPLSNPGTNHTISTHDEVWSSVPLELPLALRQVRLS